MMDRDYLYAFDLEGKDRTLTIERVIGGELTANGGKKSKKPLLYFRESKSGKPLALNSTNAKTIASIYGSNDTDDWIGKRVTLYPTVTQFGSEQVECIRIRPTKPQEPRGKAPEQTATTAEREPGQEG
jgi:hypothetical protein